MKTLNRQINISGVGLHSGEKSAVCLRPSNIPGISFKNAGGVSMASEAVVEEDSRLTGFCLPNGMKVRTGEHMLAAIAGMGLEAVQIEMEGEEVPIMDGSAFAFAHEIKEAGLCEVEGEAKKCAVSLPLTVEEKNGARLLFALPSEELKITYIIDYTGTPVGVQRASFTVTPDTFYETISRARTFGLTSELDYLKREGLARGGSLDNALVFDEKGLLGGAKLRFPQECVIHKMTDLLGDLTLSGCLPTAHYVGICAGHSIHAKLTRKLKAIFG